MRKVLYPMILPLIVLLSCQDGDKSKKTNSKIIQELNRTEIRAGQRVTALAGATLIDGNGGEPLQNAAVVIRNNVIEFARTDRFLKALRQCPTVISKAMPLGVVQARTHTFVVKPPASAR